eukprot:TRINITY_DN5426_c0_g1_i1.p1 TRINITY_DN5426_c0_g1~~TRINITY_DN5426_c0_g1_i1.p1  ORF type:complete len:413 (+),score=83.86 TRINITY_DN5426_c0_g1_i1:30-1268(+)
MRHCHMLFSFPAWCLYVGTHCLALAFAHRVAFQGMSQVSASNVLGFNTEHQSTANSGDEHKLDKYGNRLPIIVAAAQGDVLRVKDLVERGANLEAKDNEGHTPIAVAILEDHLPTVKELADQGADIEATDDEGSTALALAALMGRQDIVKELIDRGANLEAKDKNGHTPIALAILAGHLPLVKELANQGADVEATDINGNTALSLAAGMGMQDIVKELVGRGANLEAKDNEGDTALSLAARLGEQGIVKELIGHGANLEATNDFGFTPIFAAAMNGHLNSLNALRSAGADTNNPRHKKMCYITLKNASPDVIRVQSFNEEDGLQWIPASEQEFQPGKICEIAAGGHACETFRVHIKNLRMLSRVDAGWYGTSVEARGFYEYQNHAVEHKYLQCEDAETAEYCIVDSNRIRFK